MISVSDKASRFTESVIREMTRLAVAHDAINLAQGFPNFAAPDFLKKAGCSAIQNDLNQYAITWGASSLRLAISSKYREQYGLKIDPETEITVCCGATESMISSILAVVNPGDKILIFEPFYENYGPDAIIAGAQPVYLRLHPDRNWSFDPEELRRVVQELGGNGGLKALILNSPHNPSGRVFTSHELELIASLARQYQFFVITDEIYEHIIYDGHEHFPIATLEGMKNLAITISGLSKTFSVTGWRLGYAIAPPAISAAIRKMHDFLTVGAPAPLQEAAATALKVDSDYYTDLVKQYRERRDLLLPILKEIGFRVWVPQGAYYILADISDLTELEDVAFVRQLITQQGVAAVPGSSFFSAGGGRQLIRFTFCKSLDVLQAAGERLRTL